MIYKSKIVIENTTDILKIVFKNKVYFISRAYSPMIASLSFHNNYENNHRLFL